MSDDPKTPEVPKTDETVVVKPVTAWDTKIGAFAAAIGKTAEEATDRLKTLVGEPSDEALSLLADAELTPDADVLREFPGIPKAVLKKAVKGLRAAPAPVAAPTAAPVNTAASAFSLASLLPVVPDDEAFLKLLQVGGKLKMDETDVMSAVRVLYAQHHGLFDIEDRLLGEIGKKAEENDETYPPLYWKIERSLARKAHAEVLKALDISSRVVSDRNKKAFLARIEGIWGALAGFQERMNSWQTAVQGTLGNGALLGQAMIAMMSGDRTMMAASGLMTPPDPAPIVDAAAAVIDQLNKMFAGPGIPVARALAADAMQIKEILSEPELVGAVGATSHDEMIRKLGLAVTTDTVRNERSVTQYVLGVLKLPEVTVDKLPTYIMALMQVGAMIPWSTLTAGEREPAASSGRKEFKRF